MPAPLTGAAAAFAEARAPRYTSYPTALQFGPDVDEAAHRAWLDALDADEPVSLYVHIPFCRRLCWYCGCNTRAVNRPEPVAAYVRVLEREIGLVADAAGRVLPVSALHLGGGSPDSLSPEDVASLFAALRARFAFQDDIEIAAELDPAHLTQAWVDAAAREGLSRASLGVQDFSPHVQAAINRPQSVEVVREAVVRLRRAGVGSINLDLMYGLPRQKTADVLATVDAALRLSPDRLAVFGYAHVPWMKAHQRLIDSADLPGAAERFAQSEAAAEQLIRAGYVRIGLDHFARPGDAMAEAQTEGRLHRNFQGYTTDPARTLLGLGASSISRLPQGYAQNQADGVKWAADVQAGRLPTARGLRFTGDDRLRGEAIERLMCDFAVDLDVLLRRYDQPVETLDSAFDRLAGLQAQGLVTLEGLRLVVTPEGRPLVRTICTAFDRDYDAAGQRHAAAI